MPGSRIPWSRIGGWFAAFLLLGATLAVFGLHARQLQFFCDDSYISYRYSQNFAAGKGLVYNAGEYVEGYTNFLWVVLVALGIKLGVAAEPASLGLGVFFLFVTLVATFLLARRLFRSAAFAVVPCLLLVCQGPIILWSVSGLEASCFAAMTMVAVLAYERAGASWKRMLVAGALYAVSTMVRPDGVVFGAAAGLHLLLTAPFERPFGAGGLRRLGGLVVRAGALAGGFVALFGPFVLWRHSYYGDWLPNTFYVKAGGLVNVTLGLDYLRNWFLEYWIAGGLAIAGTVAALVLPRWKEQRRTFAHVALALLLFSGYLVWAGGDYMALYRFMVPLLPLAMLPATALLVTLFEAMVRVRVPRLATAAAGFVLLAFAGYLLWLPTQGSLEGRKQSKAISTVKVMKENSAQWVALGKTIKEKLPANYTIATTAAGALPYFAELRTIDQSGLCDRHTAKEESDPWWLDRPGHMKQATRAWIAKCRPQVVFWHPQLEEAPATRPLPPAAPSDEYELRAMDVPSLEGAEHCAYFWVRKDVVNALMPRGVIAAKESGRFARKSAAPDPSKPSEKVPAKREKLAEEIAADLKELDAPPPEPPPTVDPAAPAPYAGPVFVTERVHAADPASNELRVSVDNVTRPLLGMDAPAEFEVTGAQGSWLELAVASAPVLEEKAGDGKGAVVKQAAGNRVPKSVALALIQSGQRRELQSKLSDAPFAGPHRWRLVRADLTGVPPGRYVLDMIVDGNPAGRGSGWLASVPRICQRVEQQPRPNVLIITIDTLRADYLRCYGHDRPTSPNLDALAAKGVLFERDVSQAPWTLPSYASTFSGLYVENHGVVHRDHMFQYRFVTFVEKLAQAGYATGGFASGTFTDAFWGFDQGFDSYDDLGMVVDESKSGKVQAADGHAPTDRDAMKEAAHRRITSPEVANKAIAWLDAHRDQRFALFVHFFDPHEDYVKHPGVSEKFPPRAPPRDFPNLVDPKPEVTAAMRALYEGEIAYTDQHVGRVLARLRELGLDDQTIVVVFADHGEAFKEHVLDPDHDDRNRGHGGSLFNEQVHVPLLIRVPGGKPGRVAAPVGNLDVGPTLLELCGVDASGWLPADAPHGVSLVPLLEDNAAQRGEPVLTAQYLMFARENLPAGGKPAEDRVQVSHRIDKDDLCAIEYESNGRAAGASFLFKAGDRWQDYASNLATKLAEPLQKFREYYTRSRAAMEQLVKEATEVDDTGMAEKLKELGYAK